MIKRIICIICVFVVLPFATFATNSPIDVYETDIREEATILDALGIMSKYSDGTFRPNELVKRGDLVEIIIKAGAFGYKGASGNVFSDITTEHPSYEYIYAAYNLGLIRGTSENKFSPDENISGVQALKIVLDLLGYKEYVQAKGGYPAGYLIVAQEINMLKSLGNVTEPLTRGSVAKMIYIAINTVKFQQTKFGEHVQYSTDNKKTLLNDNLKLKKIEGHITSTSNTSISPYRKVAKGYIMIDSSIYLEGNTNIKELLGQYVKAYATIDDDGINTIFTYVVPRGKNIKTVIRAEDIDSSKTGIGNIASYSKGSTIENLFEIGGAVLKNGMVLTKYNDDTFKIKQGKITLVDTNGSGDNNLVIIDEAKVGVVNIYNPDTMNVFLKFGEQAVEINSNAELTVIVDGKISSADKLAEWMGITAYISDDQTIVRIIASSKKVTGIVNEISNDSIIVGDKSYEVAEAFNTYLLNDKFKICIGVSSNFVLDVEGRILAVTSVRAQIKKYGYLYKVVSSNKLDRDLVQMKLLTDDNSFKIFTLHKKVRLANEAGIIVKKASELLDNVNNLVDTDGNTIRQLIKYMTNEEMQITDIDTAIDNTALTTFSSDTLTMDCNLSYSSSRLYNNTIGINFRTNPTETKLFIVPATVKGMVVTTSDDENKYMAGTASYLGNDVNPLSNVILYGTDYAHTVGAIVQYDTGAYGSVDNAAKREVVVVDKVAKVCTEEMADAYKLYYYNRGKYFEAIFCENDIVSSWSASTNPWDGYNGTSIDSLTRGDMLQLDFDVEGKIKGFHVLGRTKTVRADTERTSNNAITTIDSVPLTYLYTAMGRIVDKYNDTFLVDVTTGSGHECSRSMLITNRTDIYLYDVDANRIEVIKAADIYKDDLVFVRTYYYSLYTVLVIRGGNYDI